MALGNSESEPFSLDLLPTAERRGLGDVRLVVFDAHEGLDGGVYFVSNALAHPGKAQLGAVSAGISTADTEGDAAAIHAQ